MKRLTPLWLHYFTCTCAVFGILIAMLAGDLLMGMLYVALFYWVLIATRYREAIKILEATND